MACASDETNPRLLITRPLLHSDIVFPLFPWRSLKCGKNPTGSGRCPIPARKKRVFSMSYEQIKNSILNKYSWALGPFSSRRGSGRGGTGAVRRRREFACFIAAHRHCAAQKILSVSHCRGVARDAQCMSSPRDETPVQRTGAGKWKNGMEFFGGGDAWMPQAGESRCYGAARDRGDICAPTTATIGSSAIIRARTTRLIGR